MRFSGAEDPARRAPRPDRPVRGFLPPAFRSPFSVTLMCDYTTPRPRPRSGTCWSRPGRDPPRGRRGSCRPANRLPRLLDTREHCMMRRYVGTMGLPQPSSDLPVHRVVSRFDDLRGALEPVPAPAQEIHAVDFDPRIPPQVLDRGW